ncbi:peptidylprolyl isomerase [Neolewinella lacunae]|uniref:peptidylprolyl isomerase n=1 Tax=Neolewinella lacunae TaxID=1517758 RepID=A0A923PIR0_9BACT|nr:peptidylprolyl isomerase [Neolewinella lacunae]MBC6993335.1 peptidylprolyl isomerase [Neolewinella lacunae]MDN3636325.1 peptidylprolyl isomerase [Neolewinella lacunae]
MKIFPSYLLLGWLVLAAAVVQGQKDSDVLFTVADEPVTVGEFRYIYTKTNGERADFSEEGVMEYLDLYQRFKLKVARARAMGLDTVAELQRELEGYRRQLADNYLVDRQVTDRLVNELYARQQQDVEISHILLQFPSTPPLPADTLRLYQRALELKQGLTAGNFASTAQQYSDDQYSKKQGGKIGFITAPFPKGLHRLEDVIYNAAPNTVVGPIQTTAGYHLAIRHASRPARGEMEVAHILARTSEVEDAARGRIQKAKILLDQGEDFAKVAATYSEDDNTKANAGYIGFFGINRYEPAFENAAFALERDGQVSDIVRTSAGFHLIRRISHRGIQPLEDVRPLLESKIKADGRYEDAKKQMLKDIRAKAKVTENKAVFGRFAAALVDSTFFTFQWQPLPVKDNTPLLTIGDDYRLSLETFQEFLRKNSRRRISLGRAPRSNAATVADALYQEWIDEQIMAYAESRLEVDFPEFAALMREYREGILLFEATKLEVWDKASDDTTGLKAFFERNAKDYRWGERAEVTHYVLQTKAGIDAEEVYAFAATNGPDKTLDKFGRMNVAAETEIYELERLAELDKLAAKVGSRSAVTNDLREGTASFYKVESMVPARQKELQEARGYVIADYQDQLEREWVDKLRQQFPVVVNKKVLAKMIKS